MSLFLDQDDNYRMEINKTFEEHHKTFLEFNSFVYGKFFPCFYVSMHIINHALLLKQEWYDGKNGSETIARMIQGPIYYYFYRRDFLDSIVGSLGLVSLIPRERLWAMIDYETYRHIGYIYYQLFQNLGNALFGAHE